MPLGTGSSQVEFPPVRLARLATDNGTPTLRRSNKSTQLIPPYRGPDHVACLKKKITRRGTCTSFQVSATSATYSPKTVTTKPRGADGRSHDDIRRNPPNNQSLGWGGGICNGKHTVWGAARRIPAVKKMQFATQRDQSGAAKTTNRTIATPYNPQVPL